MRRMSGMGEPLWDSYVRALCKRLAAKAGIEKRVHPHGLRHGWALGQVQAGTLLNAIQQLLGHRSLHTTSSTFSTSRPRQQSPRRPPRHPTSRCSRSPNSRPYARATSLMHGTRCASDAGRQGAIYPRGFWFSRAVGLRHSLLKKSESIRFKSKHRTAATPTLWSIIMVASVGPSMTTTRFSILAAKSCA